MPAKKTKPKIITQSEFVTEVAKSQGTTKTAVSNAINLVRLGAMDMLKQGKSFKLFEFMIVNIVETKERTGHNPATGEKLTIPAHDVLRIRPSETLRNIVKGDVKAKASAKEAKPKKKSK